MLYYGETLLTTYYKDWPISLPVRFAHQMEFRLCAEVDGIQVYIAHGTADKITSHKASQEFIDRLPATDKKISLFEGGRHELHNEPDGVKERLAGEIIQFVESRLPPAISVTEAEPASGAPLTEETPPNNQTPAKL